MKGGKKGQERRGKQRKREERRGKREGKRRGERAEGRRGGLSHYIILSIYFFPGWKTHPASRSLQLYHAGLSGCGRPGQAAHTEKLHCLLFPLPLQPTERSPEHQHCEEFSTDIDPLTAVSHSQRVGGCGSPSTQHISCCPLPAPAPPKDLGTAMTHLAAILKEGQNLSRI